MNKLRQDDYVIPVLMLAYSCVLIMIVISVSSYHDYMTRSDDEKMIERLQYCDSKTSKVKEVQYEHEQDKPTNIVLDNEEILQLGHNSKNLTNKDILKGNKIKYKQYKDKNYVVDVK